MCTTTTRAPPLHAVQHAVEDFADVGFDLGTHLRVQHFKDGHHVVLLVECRESSPCRVGGAVNRLYCTVLEEVSKRHLDRRFQGLIQRRAACSPCTSAGTIASSAAGAARPPPPEAVVDAEKVPSDLGMQCDLGMRRSTPNSSLPCMDANWRAASSSSSSSSSLENKLRSLARPQLVRRGPGLHALSAFHWTDS